MSHIHQFSGSDAKHTHTGSSLSGFVGHSLTLACLTLADGHYHLFDRDPSCVFRGSNTPQPQPQSVPPSFLPFVTQSRGSLGARWIEPARARYRGKKKRQKRREGEEKTLTPTLRWPNRNETRLSNSWGGRDSGEDGNQKTSTKNLDYGLVIMWYWLGRNFKSDHIWKILLIPEVQQPSCIISTP